MHRSGRGRILTRGAELIDELKQHVLRTMRGMPECAPGTGRGAGYRLVEEVAGIQVGLQGQDGWLAWSILVGLVQDGAIEVVPGTEKRRKFRLT